MAPPSSEEIREDAIVHRMVAPGVFLCGRHQEDPMELVGLKNDDNCAEWTYQCQTCDESTVYRIGRYETSPVDPGQRTVDLNRYHVDKIEQALLHTFDELCDFRSGPKTKVTVDASHRDLAGWILRNALMLLDIVDPQGAKATANPSSVGGGSGRSPDGAAGDGLPCEPEMASTVLEDVQEVVQGIRSHPITMVLGFSPNAMVASSLLKLIRTLSPRQILALAEGLNQVAPVRAKLLGELLLEEVGL